MSTKGRKSGSVSSRRSSKSSVNSNKEEMVVDVNVEEPRKLNSIVEIETEVAEDKHAEVGKREDDANSTENLTVDNHDKSGGDSQTMEPLVIENDADAELERRHIPEPKIHENGSSPVLNKSEHHADFSVPKIPQEKLIAIESDLKLTQNTSVMIEKMFSFDSEAEVKSSDTIKTSEESHNGGTVENSVEQNGDGVMQDEVVHSSTSDVNGHSDVRKSDQDYETASDTSLVVNYSGNTTRNVDFSVTEDYSMSNNDMTNNSSIPDEYMDQSPRDLSYLKTLKIISGRKTLHDLRQTSFRNALKKHEALRLAGSPIGGQSRSLKRRGDDDSLYEGVDALDYAKRLKRDENGLLSYVRNPISLLRSKLSSAPGTPQLRNYNPLLHETDNVTESAEMNVEDDKTNKWCSIQ